MSRRFFDPQPFSEGIVTELGESASHHIARVLRMSPGDELVLFNGEGGEWRARLESVGKRCVSVTPLAFAAGDRTPALAMHLGLPFIKGDRMDYAVQKATEAGARSMQLVQCERGEVRLDGPRLEKKLEHLRQVAISACEQCGMNRVPEINGVVSLQDFVKSATGLRLIAHPGDGTAGPTLLADTAEATLLTGPEGGFSEQELQVALDTGFTRFTFGDRVLRAETAPVVLMAVLQAWSAT